MPRTYFAKFVLPSGKAVEVEYSATGGEPDFDYPGHICDGGGSGPEIAVVDCWPTDEAYEKLAGRWNDLAMRTSRFARVLKWFVEFRMVWACWRRARLTTEERESVEAAIAENYVEEDDEPDYYEDFREA